VECPFNFGLLYSEKFSSHQLIIFHFKRDWPKEHEVYRLQWIGVF